MIALAVAVPLLIGSARAVTRPPSFEAGTAPFTSALASPPADPFGPEPQPEVTAGTAPAMVACDSGGVGAPDCEVNCRVLFLFYTSDCKVKCRSGFFACCSCENGCKCELDHDEMWPTPPPDPPPAPSANP